MIAMLVVGGILFAVFVVWDMQFAKSPVLPKRFLTNTTVLCGAWIGFFYFVRLHPSACSHAANSLLLCSGRALDIPNVPILLRAGRQALVSSSAAGELRDSC